jgi:hypothetical protein
MLLHIRPRLFSPFRYVTLVDLEIAGTKLVGGVDLTARRPYANKRYAVACRKVGQKAIDGILVETDQKIDEFRMVARWAVDAEMCVQHTVFYRVLDHEFDAASDSKLLWHAWAGEWDNRTPTEMMFSAPIRTEPRMDIFPRLDLQRTTCKDHVDESGLIVAREETFSMPSIEPRRILAPRWEDDRLPSRSMAFKLG